MAYTTIISTDELAAMLDEPTLLIVDVRASLTDPSAGRLAYRSAHIARAVFADLNEDLSDAAGGGRGRHPLPAAEEISRRLGRLGVDPDVQVVAYDEADGMYASRLWWMLRYVGHDAVAVLDGGFAKWRWEGRPTRSGIESVAPRAFDAAPRTEMIAGAEEVARAKTYPTRLLIDARAPERFRGEYEPVDPVAGHIPGARNRYYRTNLREDGTMRAATVLREEFDAMLGGIEPERVIVYCGSGVTACQNLLALERAGISGARLYPGSWSEWIADPRRPVATGNE